MHFERKPAAWRIVVIIAAFLVLCKILSKSFLNVFDFCYCILQFHMVKYGKSLKTLKKQIKQMEDDNYEQ